MPHRHDLSSPTPAMASRILLLLLLLSLHLAGAGPISTVVVVVMENRSFDHMLGWMKRINPAINGVTGAESNPISPSDPASPRLFFSEGAHFVDPDPGHSFQDIRQQIFGSDNAAGAGEPPMNGFVMNARSNSPAPNMSSAVMNGFPPEMVPVYRALVEEFAVFDRWFASVPSSTQPNRMFVHSGTSGGATNNDPRCSSSSSSLFSFLINFN